jgi:hypothetical protein
VVTPPGAALACSLPGSVPEWPKGADCKSAGIAFGGSNPPRPTETLLNQGMVERVTAIRTLDSVRRAADSTGNTSLGPLLEAWWSDYARSLRRRRRTDRTIGAYRRSFEDLWRFQLGHGVDDPATLSRDDINRWTDNLTSRARRDGRTGGLTGQTVAILWRNARPFFAWWASEEDAPNPFANADRPPEGERSPAVIHLDDVRALVAAVLASNNRISLARCPFRHRKQVAPLGPELCHFTERGLKMAPRSGVALE